MNSSDLAAMGTVDGAAWAAAHPRKEATWPRARRVLEAAVGQLPLTADVDGYCRAFCAAVEAARAQAAAGQPAPVFSATGWVIAKSRAARYWTGSGWTSDSRKALVMTGARSLAETQRVDVRTCRRRQVVGPGSAAD